MAAFSINLCERMLRNPNLCVGFGDEWTGVDMSGLEWSRLESTGVEWTGVEWSGMDRTEVECSGVEVECSGLEVAWSEAVQERTLQNRSTQSCMPACTHTHALQQTIVSMHILMYACL